MGRFEGLQAIVTGGAGGIGGAVSTTLAAEGCRVIATGFSDEEIALRRDDPDFAGIDLRVLDVGKDEHVSRLVVALDRLDILVNCAGTTARGASAFEEDEFQRVLDINLSGTMRMCRAAEPLLAKTSGAIVNIASLMSFFGSGTAPGYAASKGGVALLTKSLAIAWADRGIRVNAIAPGWIETPMTKKNIDPGLYQKAVQRTPMRRWGNPQDIADPVLFLCSPQAAFITGAVIPVDGGYSAA